MGEKRIIHELFVNNSRVLLLCSVGEVCVWDGGTFRACSFAILGVGYGGY
jgi:hypothetical protein